MKTTALEFAFAAEAFNLAGETITTPTEPTPGQLPDTTEPAAVLLTEPTAKPAEAAPLFLDTVGEYLASVHHDAGAGPFPYRYALREILTGRQIAGGYEASPAAARASAADMAAALAL
jgi:hypothetical protein